MSTCRRLTLAAMMLLGAPFAPGNAAAQTSAQDQATARALFNDARELMKSGSYDAACAKLEAASQLYAGSGVLLNLGDCYEHLGRSASAWTEFAEAASAAEREARADDLAEARRRQSALEPKLARLTIQVPSEVPGLVVKRDGAPLVRGAWGTGIPADPGTHTVTAEAPGHATWTQSVSVTEAGKTVSIEVPELTPEATAPPAPAPVAVPAVVPALTPAPDYWTARRMASALLTGVGVVGLGVGGTMVIVAKTQDDTARGEAGPARATDSANAVQLGNVATVITSVGAVVAVGGLVLWLTAPRADVRIGTGGSGVLVAGSF